eukprot:Pgem_evm2s13940
MSTNCGQRRAGGEICKGSILHAQSKRLVFESELEKAKFINDFDAYYKSSHESLKGFIDKVSKVLNKLPGLTTRFGNSVGKKATNTLEAARRKLAKDVSELPNKPTQELAEDLVTKAGKNNAELFFDVVK